MEVVAAHLRRLGVSVFPYLNDWLLKEDMPQNVISHLRTTANLLHTLVLTVNVLKSHLTPSQMLPFFRAVLDTVQFQAYPLEKRVQDIRAMTDLSASILGFVVHLIRVVHFNLVDMSQLRECMSICRLHGLEKSADVHQMCKRVGGQRGESDL
ncbi:hypothetical protein NDU88_008494 [Pleurodeles waltl]|uniref:Uncharacterized protein n=1 Tax=Pleurodeles waltl TaxID=8319 RepID=A0AAV7QNP0_PLEWA|nr:hypothetical protein NDU88_008494 [Pleurodeles waltl]